MINIAKVKAYCKDYQEKMSESAKHRKKPHPGGKCFKGMKWKEVDGKRIWYV